MALRIETSRSTGGGGGGGTVQDPTNLWIIPTDEGATAGNTRGVSAVDLQSSRALAAQVASGSCSVISGGYDNMASTNFSVVAGGWNNSSTSSTGAVVGGGYLNLSTGKRSTVAGGQSNTASNNYATVSGGKDNTAQTGYATIGGGALNYAPASYATIGGGTANTTSGTYSAVGGGCGNVSSEFWGTIAGGRDNRSSANYSIVGGGGSNTASATYSVVGGGRFNVASGSYSFVGGGNYGVANKFGQQAHASGKIATTGDAQTSQLVARNQTTDATVTELFLDGVDDRLAIATDTVWVFEATIVARRTDADNEGAGYKISGVIDNNAGTTALIGAISKTTFGEDTAAWDVTAEADDTNDALVIKVTGENAKTINWVAFVRTTEVTG